MTFATCHTDRKHAAKGLCRSCYNQQNFKAQGRKYKNRHNYETYKSYYEENKDRIKARAKEYYLKNKKARLAYIKKYAKENEVSIKEYKKQYRKENKAIIKAWFINNREIKNSHTAKRRAQHLLASPNWLTKQHLDEILVFFQEAKRLSDANKIIYHVDHIIPLQGEEVCGLHVPWNLQVLEAIHNIKKSNKI